MTMAVTAVPPVVHVRELVDTLRNCNHQVRERSYTFGRAEAPGAVGHP